MKNNYLNELSQEEFERIERYVQHQMSLKERQHFEEILSTDPALQNEVELHKQLVASLEVDAFLHEIQKKPATENTPVRTIRPSFRRKWLIAASVALIMLAGAAWWMLSPSKQERLYAQYFVADPGLPTNMGTEEEYEFYRGMVDYKSGHYDLAITRWEKLYAADSLNTELAYFLGAAWLNSGNTVNAAPFLEQVSRDNASPFRKSAIWYHALANVREGNNSKAVDLLNSIPDYPEAPELLRKLSRDN